MTLRDNLHHLCACTAQNTVAQCEMQSHQSPISWAQPQSASADSPAETSIIVCRPWTPYKSKYHAYNKATHNNSTFRDQPKPTCNLSTYFCAVKPAKINNKPCDC